MFNFTHELGLWQWVKNTGVAVAELSGAVTVTVTPF
jgi:hypothetical protein